MTRVMAQGTFDVLHPGHLHYLKESAALGDELHVVVARDERVRDKKDLLMDHDERREVIASLEVVDEAHVGSKGDLYEILGSIHPDVITIGFDQPYDADQMEVDLENEGYGGISVVRIGRYEADADELVSSSEIKEELRDQYD